MQYFDIYDTACFLLRIVRNSSEANTKSFKASLLSVKILSFEPCHAILPLLMSIMFAPISIIEFIS